MLRLIVLACVACLASVAPAGEAPESDIISLKGGVSSGRQTQILGFIIAESTTQAWIRNAQGAGQAFVRPWREIATVDYLYRRDPTNAFGRGSTAFERGTWEIAAVEFEGGFSTGKYEPEKVACALRAADSYENAGKYAEAASILARMCAQHPRNRYFLDAKGREGFYKALAKDAAGAEAVIAELEALGKTDSLARTRASMVRAAKAAAADDFDAFEKEASRVLLSETDDFEAWMQFTLFRAVTLMRSPIPGKAPALLKQLSDKVPPGHPRASGIAFQYAMSLLKANPDQALIALLRLDALPAGSPEQKAVARFHIGRLLTDGAEKAFKDPASTEQRREFARNSIRTAKLVLDACVNSAEAAADLPERASAQALLDTIAALEGIAGTGSSATAAATATGAAGR